MRRVFREASDATKAKMRIAHQGRTQSQETKDKISKSMEKYWQTVPSANDLKNADITNNKSQFNPYE